MRRISIVALLLAVLAISGCAGTISNMRHVPVESAPVGPAKDKALVVFSRPSGMGFAIQSSVYEIISDAPTLIGIVAAKTKVAHQVAPGQHLFMVIGENADFLSANLLPGKTYYVYVAPRMGMWKARFALEPKRRTDLDSAEFKAELEECKWVETNSESNQWMQGNLTSIHSKRAEYYKDWLQRPAPEKLQLLPEDGR